MEQALVLASIILGVAVALELENLNRLIRAPKVRWHWAQPIFAIFVLFIVMFFWWSLADEDPARSIKLGEFVPIMWSLVMLVLLCAVALPDKISNDEPVDLAAYYQDNHRYMWTLILLFGLPLQSQWFWKVAHQTSSVGEFVNRTSGDLVAWTVIIFMIFARRWWMVALGMVIISLGPIAWLSRTL